MHSLPHDTSIRQTTTNHDDLMPQFPFNRLSHPWLKVAPHWIPHAGCGSAGWQLFTHFEVVRLMKLAAWKLEKAQSCTKNDNLRQYMSIYSVSLIISYQLHTIKYCNCDCERQTLQCELRVSHSPWISSKMNDRAKVLMQKSIWRANLSFKQVARRKPNQKY